MMIENGDIIFGIIEKNTGTSAKWGIFEGCSP
jgi:hypothetical protein